jgi:hypothetical protein
MRTFSVSELTTNRDCPRQHHFKYRERLRANHTGSGWQAASGTAVHYVLEQHCRNNMGQPPQKADVEALIFESLNEDFKGDDKKIDKFTPGVRRALIKVPDWVWTENWYLEHDIQGYFGPPDENSDPEVCLRGRPDVFRVSDDFVELVDFKTTQTDPLTFMLWTPQIRFYAAMLHQIYPDKLVKYRYMCFPTQGTGSAPMSASWPFTLKAYAQAESEILKYASEITDKGFDNPHYGRICDWCDFGDVCKVVITGGDWKELIKEEYHVREPHG